MKTPNDKHPMAQRILSALEAQPLHLNAIAKQIGMDPLRTMGHMKKLREGGWVRLTGWGKYEAMP